jgi:ribonuclease BN (tRNA processing enzyme)
VKAGGNMKLQFSGTGTMGCARRGSTSAVIDGHILFDIGSGVLAQMKQYHMNISAIDTILMTHFHADHFLDIVPYLFRRSIRREIDYPLQIIGPEGVRRKIIDLLDFTHANGRLGAFDHLEEKYGLKVLEIAEETLSFGEYTLTSWKMMHGRAFPCNGYVLEKAGEALGFSGDTSMCEGLLRLIDSAEHLCIDSNAFAMSDDHLGFQMARELAQKHPDKRFYCVHRGEYETGPLPVNIMLPEDGALFDLKTIK